MVLSQVIKDLTAEMEAHGDVYVRKFSISDESGTMERNMLSPTRKKKHGQRAVMNQQEFDEYVACEKKGLKL